ncbi:class I SAM-dependent methyltransferase [Xenorhabdus sp. XENO-7]|uniref:Class I SAM-dependent methyltransferase n=1 Tax=Xenorhabdus aichiensis TaxID=3025874 RepID=A0ABT5LZG6_9GAMM|nr:class I SAM-dependent methyltransferase [Xenorhabdus aichiensis]MDC9620814.1 class I SAM-dependent methyltransferase [Xenorhabdus aichiensis]
MLNDIIDKINQAISYPIKKQSGLLPEFDFIVKKIRDELLFIKRNHPDLYHKFSHNQEQLLSKLDNKIILDEKNHETIIASFMCGKKTLIENEISTLSENRKFYTENYRSLYFDERKLLEQSPKYICHIGCGPMPASILMWMKYTNAKVTAIDYDKDAIESAREVFENWRHHKGVAVERATFITEAGENFNYAGIDLILLSSSIVNKENVYAAILNSAIDTVNVIERIPHFLYHSQFRGSTSFEHYLLATKERNDMNLRLYRFPALNGEQHGK